MPDDWAQQYIDSYKQKEEIKRRVEQEKRKQRQLTEAGGPEMFDKIRKRVERDVQTFRSVVAFQALEVRALSPTGKFQVYYPSPRMTLDVDFNVPLIPYEYMFSSKEGSEKVAPERISRTLRISSDLEGHLTVCKNGSEEGFEDESEVSEFLLKPIVDRIQGELLKP